MKPFDMKVDKMRYQTNSAGYLFVFLSLVFSIVALFTLINYDSFGEGLNPTRVVPDLRIGIEITIGIILMLLTFLAAEKVKFYDPIWSYYGLFILAGINFLRIFNIPKYAFDKGWITESTKFWTSLELAVSALLLIVAGIISVRKVYLLHNHMKAIDKHGNNAV